MSANKKNARSGVLFVRESGRLRLRRLQALCAEFGIELFKTFRLDAVLHIERQCLCRKAGEQGVPVLNLGPVFLKQLVQ